MSVAAISPGIYWKTFAMFVFAVIGVFYGGIPLSLFTDRGHAASMEVARWVVVSGLIVSVVMRLLLRCRARGMRAGGRTARPAAGGARVESRWREATAAAAGPRA